MSLYPCHLILANQSNPIVSSGTASSTGFSFQMIMQALSNIIKCLIRTAEPHITASMKQCSTSDEICQSLYQKYKSDLAFTVVTRHLPGQKLFHDPLSLRSELFRPHRTFRGDERQFQDDKEVTTICLL